MNRHLVFKEIQVHRAKAQDKAYTLNDGNGLSLLIEPNGSKIYLAAEKTF
ncbi:integrase [Yersinia kristensenii]|uniref:Integrase n=1 Tax=Yersinia kristensenii TaxID=28152 RepID=A0AB73QD25_YERKR|nr:integrase [Yersinia kristensenii]